MGKTIKQRLLNNAYLSLRAKRGNLGGASDCFGTDVPRNDRGDVIAVSQSPECSEGEAWQSQQLPPLNLPERLC